MSALELRIENGELKMFVVRIYAVLLIDNEINIRTNCMNAGLIPVY
jgi:hypothetical protein